MTTRNEQIWRSFLDHLAGSHDEDARQIGTLLERERGNVNVTEAELQDQVEAGVFGPVAMRMWESFRRSVD